MTCKWCKSKQILFDLIDGTKECSDCHILRRAILNNPKVAILIIKEITNGDETTKKNINGTS